MKKEIYTIMIVALLVMGVVVLETKRSIRETPVTDSKSLTENGYRGISSQALMERLGKNDGLILLDLRTNEEFKEGHISGAINLPVAEIDNAARYIDKDREIVLYCKSGPWSRQTYNILKIQGFSNLKVLANGIVGWKWEVNGPLVKSKD